MRNVWILGAGALAVATACYVHRVASRGVSVIPESAPAGKFDRLQSAALFVGVRQFDEGAAIEVPYAVDDAVDLAYAFTLDRRSSLVPASRVVLALSGRPQKEESRVRLERLKAAGATVRNATAEEIRRQLERLATEVGKDGILIFSLATHGFIDQRRQAHVLGSNSLFDDTRTTLPLETLIDTAAASRAKRSLLFIDACRERFRTGSRGLASDPLTAAPSLINRMSRAEGQVVFYAAPAGGYAYDDDRNQNGVFTRAVINGLGCEATAVDGLITVEKLAEYVEREVLAWVRTHREADRRQAIQVSTSGRTDLMPLAVCSCPPCPPLGPDGVRTSGSIVTALDERSQRMWNAAVAGEIAEATVADLDADGAREVVVHVKGNGADGGRIVMFDAQGKRAWAVGSSVERMYVGVVRRKYKDEIIAVTPGGLSMFDARGAVIRSYDFASARHVQVGRPSTLHDLRIVAAGAHRLALFHPNREGKALWERIAPAPIESMQVIDGNRDGKLDIAITTTGGHTYHYDFAKGRRLD